MFTYITQVWYLHRMLTCGVHMWSPHVVFCMRFTVFTCGVHMWSPHVVYLIRCPVFTCGVHMWSPHVESTYDLKYVPYVIYRMWFTVCGVHMWFSLKSYTDIKSYTENHMWFSVYDFRMWSPYVEFVCGVHMWFSSMIIYGPYMITYGNHTLLSQH